MSRLVMNPTKCPHIFGQVTIGPGYTAVPEEMVEIIKGDPHTRLKIEGIDPEFVPVWNRYNFPGTV